MTLLESLGFRKRPEPRRPLVVFQTPFLRPDDGWSVAARAYARAMRMGGIDVRLIPYGRETPFDGDEAVLSEVGEMFSEREIDHVDLLIRSNPLMVTKHMAPELLSFRGAFHAVFEVDSVESGVAVLLNRYCLGIWAQCTYNRDALEKAGAKNVELISPPWFPDDPLLAIPARQRSRRFLWIGRAEQRKAPDRLVKAFLHAFRPGEATLTLKLSRWKSPIPYPEPEQTIAEECGEAGWTLGQAVDAIVIKREKFSREEMIGLYCTHDVYCSASRGEGWDLPCYEAKLSGMRVVSTDSGGVRDFLGMQDILIPATGRITAPPTYGGSYLDHSFDAIVAALQEARGGFKVKEFLSPSERLPERLRADKVAERFRAWIEKLTARDTNDVLIRP